MSVSNMIKKNINDKKDLDLLIKFIKDQMVDLSIDIFDDIDPEIHKVGPKILKRMNNIKDYINLFIK